MDSVTPVYEKLGVFYLGKEFDLDQSRRGDDYVLYDSKDLVTHAVIVGMTGSGKTGLGVGLLEEAAIDGIPALIIDPKGDLANLLLQFPELSPSDFEPWLQADDAARKGLSTTQYAEQMAARWREGLQEWDQDASRIQRLHDAVDYTIYTPGSDAGCPVSILSSFTVPPPAVLEDGDLLRERIASTATSLLALLGVDADPLRSREHILLTNLLHHAWTDGQDLDLGRLIQLVQEPPMKQIGVMDLEAFFPSKDRFTLAITLNNLLAAPGFSAWLRGEPLDIQRLLFTESGKPRHAIFSIAHLSDSERMFFVSLLLNQTLGWMRSQSGTTSLRALLYIDEIFGYMPPVKEPASKKPLLTLLKQARAFGLGVVLATQNPVDLDYKGLSNTGTWFLGRLQTERDKERMLDGLAGASAEAGDGFDRRSIAELLSKLGSRVFLMHNVHEDRPVVFQTRWALSFLTGPMTRHQIKQLMTARGTGTMSARENDAAASAKAEWTPTHRPAPSPPEAARPVLSPQVNQFFLPVPADMARGPWSYEPYVMAVGRVHFVDARKGLAADESLMLLAEIDESAFSLDWAQARELAASADVLENSPAASARFASLPSPAGQEKNYATWRKQLEEHLYRTRRFSIWKSDRLNAYSEPGESEGEFRVRLSMSAREERDRRIEELRRKSAAKLRSLQERIDRAEQAVDRETQEASSAKMQTAISFGASVLGAILGRKSSRSGLGGVTSAARGVDRYSRQTGDVRRAEQKLMAHRDELLAFEAELEADVERLRTEWDPLTESLSSIELRPRRTDISITHFGLGWVPVADV
jgi:hypothetical protein